MEELRGGALVVSDDGKGEFAVDAKALPERLLGVIGAAHEFAPAPGAGIPLTEVVQGGAAGGAASESGESSEHAPPDLGLVQLKQDDELKRSSKRR